MKCIRPTHVALAMLAGTVAAGPADACPPCGPMMAPVSAAPPSVRPPTSPSVRPVIPNIQGAVDATNKAARDAVEYTDVKGKIRAKNPKATEGQVDAGAKKIITKRRQIEAEDRQALKESKEKMDKFGKALEDARLKKWAIEYEKARKQREYREWKKQDNADTNLISPR